MLADERPVIWGVMGRPTLSEEQFTNMRKRIRGAAFELFIEGGFDAVSIREVAKRVGVSPSRIYFYYTNRHRLIEAIWYEPVAQVVREMLEISRKNKDPEKRIDRILQRYQAFALAQPEIFREALLFVRPRQEDSPRRENLEGLPLFTVLRDAIRDGQKAGLFRQGDAGIMAQTLWMGVHGALALPINIDGWDYADQEVLNRSMVKTLIAGLA